MYIRIVNVTDLIWLGQRLTAAGRAELQDSAPGLPIADLIVMGDLMIHSPSSIKEIAARTGYVQSRVSTSVASIVERGWAVIDQDPADGRRTLVVVPAETLKRAKSYQRQAQTRALDHLLEHVPVRRRRAVEAALTELVTALRN
jgi:DNA-binding MarR family transcriptional regulator